jgi:hypothetical protein
VIRFPSPPHVSWALSGFVVGVFVTLLATGVFFHTANNSATSPPPTPPTPRSVPPSALQTDVSRIIMRQLGKYTTSRELRLVKLKLVNVSSLQELIDPVAGATRYRSLVVQFRLDDNPLGPTWRLRTAKADVFSMLKALYTSGLPVYDTLLIGLYPLKSGTTTSETQALVAYETHADATRIPWRQWGRDREGTLWNNLSSHSVDPRFA